MLSVQEISHLIEQYSKTQATLYKAVTLRFAVLGAEKAKLSANNAQELHDMASDLSIDISKFTS